jgi:Staphylococcal nuclease homologue
LCCDGFLVHGFGSFSGHGESYTAEEETPSSTAKALHVLPSRDYQSPFARRSDAKDRYSRTLAYVFLQDGMHLNAEIIRQGYGFAVSGTPPLKYQNEFRRLELEARE